MWPGWTRSKTPWQRAILCPCLRASLIIDASSAIFLTLALIPPVLDSTLGFAVDLCIGRVIRGGGFREMAEPNLGRLFNRLGRPHRSFFPVGNTIEHPSNPVFKAYLGLPSEDPADFRGICERAVGLAGALG